LAEITDMDVNTQPERRERLIAAINLADIEVVFPRIPDIEFEEFVTLYQHRMISKEDFYRMGLDSKGLVTMETNPPKEFLNNVEKMYPIPKEGNDLFQQMAGKRPKPDSEKGGSSSKPKAKKQKVQASEAPFAFGDEEERRGDSSSSSSTSTNLSPSEVSERKMRLELFNVLKNALLKGIPVNEMVDMDEEQLVIPLITDGATDNV